MAPEPLPSKIGKTVGEKLRAARISMHYTQGQLAAPDFSVSYISAIERGQIHPSLRALEILAGRLGLTSTQLLPARAQPEERAGGGPSSLEREEEEIELTLLDAQVMIDQHTATHAAERLMKLPPKRLKPQHLLEYRYLLGRAYLEDERFQEAEYALSDALQQAKEQENQFLHPRILHMLALAHAAMNNISQALLLDQRSLDLLESDEASDPFFIAQVYMHMGQHYTQQDHFEQAREMFARALAIVEELSNPHAIQSTYGYICQLLANTGQHELIEKYAHKCLYIAAQEKQNHLRSELYHYLGRAMMTANQEQAGIFLERALTQESVTRDQLSRASLLTSKAEWYLKQGTLDDAARKAKRAVELASPFGDSIIHATSAIILGTVEYALSNHEAGDQHFTAGLDMLERLGHHEELAEAAVRYAQLLEEYGKAREAFIYFRRAFESQQLQRR